MNQSETFYNAMLRLKLRTTKKRLLKILNAKHNNHTEAIEFNCHPEKKKRINTIELN